MLVFFFFKNIRFDLNHMEAFFSLQIPLYESVLLSFSAPWLTIIWVPASPPSVWVPGFTIGVPCFAIHSMIDSLSLAYESTSFGKSIYPLPLVEVAPSLVFCVLSWLFHPTSEHHFCYKGGLFPCSIPFELTLLYSDQLLALAFGTFVFALALSILLYMFFITVWFIILLHVCINVWHIALYMVCYHLSATFCYTSPLKCCTFFL